MGNSSDVSNVNGSMTYNHALLGEDMEVQKLLQEHIENSKAVGAVVGFIDQGQVKYFSYNKKSASPLVSEESIFEIGSITKVFTTLMLMEMVHDGKMQLDDHIEMYLPGVGLKIPQMDAMKITLHHLATHTSGLPCLPDNFDPKNPSNPYADYSKEKLYQFLNCYTLQRLPGKQYEYSNLGMGILGHILSLKSGKSYEEIVSDICKKIGMKNTVITLDSERKKLLVKGHHEGSEVENWDLDVLEGAGALRSDIRDMTLFLAANMGMINTVLYESLKNCHIAQFECEESRDSTGKIALKLGLGWHVLCSKDSEVVFHNGRTGGCRSFLGFNPKEQKGL